MTYLTREDLEKIRKYLVLTGIKDTEFDLIASLFGTEDVAIVLGNLNKRVKLTDLLTFIVSTVKLSIANNTADISKLYDLVKKLSESGKIDPSDFEGINAMYYPSDSIPDTAESTLHGNMASYTKEELATKSLSQLFDMILFKEDLGSIISDGKSGNTITYTGNSEVGSTYTKDNFSVNHGQMVVQYPYTTIDWVPGDVTGSGGTVQFGSNTPSILCTFTIDNSDIVLQTTYGSVSSVQLSSSDCTDTKKPSFMGYYNFGWTYDNDQQYIHSFQVTQKLTDYRLETTQSNPYIYLYIPSVFTLKSFKVQDPLDSSVFNEVSNFEAIVSNQPITSLSNNYTYTIYRAGKATNNSDGTPTPNNKPIKITIE